MSGVSPQKRTGLSQDYIARLFGKESEDLLRVKKALADDGKEGINVSSSEGALLKFFIQAFGLKNILEIGTLYGYSTLWMAESLPEDGQITSIEKSTEHYEKAKALISQSKSNDKIKLHHGDALKVLSKVNIKPDMVFIDADKAGYSKYLDWAFENLAEGGLIVGDNTFLFGHITGEANPEQKVSSSAIQAMSEFNERIAQAPGFSSIIIPTIEGMTVAKKLD